MSESLTPLSSRAAILADLWMNYRDDEEFLDFIEYNDLGLPLAYAFSNGIISQPNDVLEQLINETFNLLMSAMDIEDTGFESLDDIFGTDFID
jgi:hypothetical protein